VLQVILAGGRIRAEKARVSIMGLRSKKDMIVKGGAKIAPLHNMSVYLGS
jgi:hypothetical protein